MAPARAAMASTRSESKPSQDGFTLIELVLVMAMIAIVATISVPRLVGSNSWESLFLQEFQAALRYAGSLAVASGCTVQVTIRDTGGTAIVASGPGNGYDLLMEDGNCDSGVFATQVFNPANNNQPYTGQRPGTLAFTSDLNPIYVDPLGRFTNLAGTPTDIVVTIGGRTLSIVGETGYVQAN